MPPPSDTCCLKRISEQRLKTLIGRFNAFQKPCAQTNRTIPYPPSTTLIGKYSRMGAIKYLPHLPIKMVPWQKFCNQDDRMPAAANGHRMHKINMIRGLYEGFR